MKRKSKIKFSIIIALLLVLIILSGRNTTDEIKVSLAYPKKGKITQVVSGSGELIPSIQVNLTSEIPGEILEIYFHEGEYVRKGELIVKLNEENYLSEVERAKAAHNMALEQFSEHQSRYFLQKKIFLRDSILFYRGAISSEEYEKSQTELEIVRFQLNSAKYNIESANTAIVEAQKALAKTSIYSPIDGTVIEVNANEGEKVAGTSQMAGTQIMKIADLKSIEVIARINERNILDVSPGDSVSISIDAISNGDFAGKVHKIAHSTNRSYNDLRLGEYLVTIGFDSLPAELKCGMTASVEIITHSKDNILTVPLESVISKECFFNEETQIKEYVFLYLPESSSVQMKEITTGIQDYRRIEVIDGDIDEYSRIVTGPYNTINEVLKEGSRVSYE